MYEKLLPQIFFFLSVLSDSIPEDHSQTFNKHQLQTVSPHIHQLHVLWISDYFSQPSSSNLKISIPQIQQAYRPHLPENQIACLPVDSLFPQSSPQQNRLPSKRAHIFLWIPWIFPFYTLSLYLLLCSIPQIQQTPFFP